MENLAGEYDDKFEEITGMLQKMQKSVGGLEELRMEVRDIRSELRQNTSNLKSLNSNLKSLNSNLKSLNQKVDVLSGQFEDVGIMAIKDQTRIDNLEERVNILESEVH